METSVTLQRAIELARLEIIDRKTETVQLDDAAGRVLATNLASKVDDPRFDNSAMDGWSVRAADCKAEGTTLSIVGTSKAGGKASPEVGIG